MVKKTESSLYQTRFFTKSFLPWTSNTQFRPARSQNDGGISGLPSPTSTSITFYANFCVPKSIVPRPGWFISHPLCLRDNDSDVCKFYFVAKYWDNVQELYICAHCNPMTYYEFPSCFINSESLMLGLVVDLGRDLKGKGKSTPLDKRLRLPGLKTLHLTGFVEGSANFITDTVGNCPNLETLILDDLALKRVNITAPQLRNLELYYEEQHWYTEFYGSNNYEYYGSEIVVSAPTLSLFKLEGQALPFFCAVGGFIDVDHRAFNEIFVQRVPHDVVNMLRQFREANSVTLSHLTLEVLTMDIDSLKSHPSPFHKLKHLKLIAEEWQPEEDTCPTLTVPINVITYLTQSSSCGDTFVVNFPREM